MINGFGPFCIISGKTHTHTDTDTHTHTLTYFVWHSFSLLIHQLLSNFISVAASSE